MDSKEILKLLQTKIQSTGVHSESTLKRKKNIEWVKTLDCKDLVYGCKEKQILLQCPSPDLEICIQYPGKESVLLPKKPQAQRPWDFRPKLYYKGKEVYHKDISFDEIWADFEKKFIDIKNKEALRILAILFYRMAFMVDHILVEEEPLRVRILKGNVIEKESEENFCERYKYTPNQEALSMISEDIPQVCDMQIGVFLYVLELLTWNEDCKYFYPNLMKAISNPRKDGRPRTPAWIATTGRVNTLLTIINFLGVLLGEISFSALFSKFARTGVSGIEEKDLLRVCRGMIVGGIDEKQESLF